LGLLRVVIVGLFFFYRRTHADYTLFKNRNIAALQTGTLVI
jgi:hypothetical protein